MFDFSGVVHENPQIGSDGESEEGSRHSEEQQQQISATDSAAASATSGQSVLSVKLALIW